MYKVCSTCNSSPPLIICRRVMRIGLTCHNLISKKPSPEGYFLYLLNVYIRSTGAILTIIDPQTSLGKIRLRIGDWQSLPILPDSVILSALDDCQGNVPRAASLCAQYILGTLTAKTHRKLAQIETWSGEQFTNYVAFIKLTILNPNMMSVAPVPYTGNLEEHPLIEFVADWNAAHCPRPTNTAAF